MKKTLRFFAMALTAGAMLTACGGDDEGGNGGGGEVKPPVNPVIDNVHITSAPTGSVKAGMPDAVEIIGEGFDEVQDFVRVGYMKDGVLTYDKVSSEALTLKPKRISFGIHVDAEFVGTSFKVYLDRPGYEYMALTGDLTVTMPTVAEGYIPDRGFRATLNSDFNNMVKPLFNSLGLLDVAAAAQVTNGCTLNGTYGLNLYGTTAASLEGIELFSNITGLVVGWGASMPNLKAIDFSKWTAKNIDIRVQGSPLLESFIGAPYAKNTFLGGCPKLTTVDVHGCRWLQRLEVSPVENAKDDEKISACTLLDIRRNHTGTYTPDPKNPETDYALWNDGVQGFRVANNAKIKIDTYFLVTHSAGGGNTWDDIYDAWKNKNATIEVYSRIAPHCDELLGTVPMASVQPDALAPTNNLGGDDKPANKWQVDDPYTPENEAPAVPK